MGFAALASNIVGCLESKPEASEMMTESIIVRWSVAGFAALAAAGAASSEPLVSQGMGAANCEQLAADLNPAQGLANPINLALVAWVQGYVSAANMSLLEENSRHVDMSTLDETKVLTMVQDFCKANPDKKPVAAVDDLIRKSEKVKTTWEPGTVRWEGEEEHGR